MRFIFAAPVSAIVCAAAPASAFAADYMTADQAARLMFPDADSFDMQAVALDGRQLQQLDASGVRGRSANWTVRVARRTGAALGFVITDDVVGKVELISYAVGLSLDGRIKQIEILSYRESHGSEVRLPAWRRQFVGKGREDALRVGDDIANISGATLSCTHLADGVKRIVAVVALARGAGALHD